MNKDGLVFLGLLGFGALLLMLTARREPVSYPIRLRSQAVPAEGLLHYKNKETRDVEWSEDGLPVRITIEREYYQLP